MAHHSQKCLGTLQLLLPRLGAPLGGDGQLEAELDEDVGAVSPSGDLLGLVSIVSISK